MQAEVPIIALGMLNQGGKLRVRVLGTWHPRQPARLKDHSMQTGQYIRYNSLLTRLVLQGQLVGGKEFHPMNLVRG